MSGYRPWAEGGSNVSLMSLSGWSLSLVPLQSWWGGGPSVSLMSMKGGWCESEFCPGRESELPGLDPGLSIGVSNLAVFLGLNKYIWNFIIE